MALPSAFRERLEQMEHARNQRLSLLQAERELHIKKSQLLATKHSDIRSAEQRCFKLDHKIASLQFAISSLKSHIDVLDSDYNRIFYPIRKLKSEIEELEELEKEKERFYDMNKHEIHDFSAEVDNFAAQCEIQVQELQNSVNLLKSSFSKLQEDGVCVNNSEIAAAEVRKYELLTAKENLDNSLASNYQIKSQLQKQLYRLLSTKQKKRKEN